MLTENLADASGALGLTPSSITQALALIEQDEGRKRRSPNTGRVGASDSPVVGGERGEQRGHPLRGSTTCTRKPIQPSGELVTFAEGGAPAAADAPCISRFAKARRCAEVLFQRRKNLGCHQGLLVVKAAPYRQGDEDRQKGEDTHYRNPPLQLQPEEYQSCHRDGGKAATAPKKEAPLPWGAAGLLRSLAGNHVGRMRTAHRASIVSYVRRSSGASDVIPAILRTEREASAPNGQNAWGGWYRRVNSNPRPLMLTQAGSGLWG